MVAEFKQKTGEPWATQHFVTTYGDMWIFKAALEAAGKADRAAVAKALRSMDLTDGPAVFPVAGEVDENGRRVAQPRRAVAIRRTSPYIRRRQRWPVDLARS
jgi:branched-chain amino acid transport system substrate-binding protein